MVIFANFCKVLHPAQSSSALHDLQHHWLGLPRRLNLTIGLGQLATLTAGLVCEVSGVYVRGIRRIYATGARHKVFGLGFVNVPHYVKDVSDNP